MNKSTNKALSILGSIALLNEEIMEFLFWCYGVNGYDELQEVNDPIMDERFERILEAEVNIVVSHRRSGAFLQAAYCKAIEKQDLKTAKKALRLYEELLAVVEETEEGKTNKK